jgi:hypothetical protein
MAAVFTFPGLFPAVTSTDVAAAAAEFGWLPDRDAPWFPPALPYGRPPRPAEDWARPLILGASPRT